MESKFGIVVVVNPGQDGLVGTMTLKCDRMEFKGRICEIISVTFQGHGRSYET